MRSNEARTLRWHQIDFEGEEIAVGKAKTEAGTARRIPMSGVLKAALQQHAAWCARKLWADSTGVVYLPVLEPDAACRSDAPGHVAKGRLG
ncbi:MAG: hypothetical protein FJW37_12415, partial [Acidobacteria bacterium]|nr:hypothetical protein [Acidobacteriota bacterium]